MPTTSCALRCGMLSTCLVLGLSGGSLSTCHADVPGHEVTRQGELIATDLKHGAGPGRVSVQRQWHRSPRSQSPFGPGWGDLNVLVLKPAGLDGVMIYRGGLPWKYGQGSDDSFRTHGNCLITKQSGGWRMDHPNEGTWHFDAQGRLISYQNLFEQSTEFTYDPQGRLRKIEYDPSNFLLYHYASEHDGVVRVEGPEGVYSRYEYDPSGRLVAVLNAWQERVDYEYDAEGILLAVTGRHGERMAVPPPVDWELPSAEAAAELAARRRRLAGNGVSSGTPPSFETDRRGQLQTIHDDGREMQLEYDSAGRLAAIESAGERESFQYDQFGRVVATTAADGITQRIAYNRFDWPIEISYSDGTSTRLAYDTHGRLLSAVDTSGEKQEWAYDDLGRKVRERSTPGVEEVYTYDESGLLSNIDYSDGRNVEIASDERGNRIAEAWNNGETWRYAYDDRGYLVEETSPTGLVTRYSYDDAGRLLSIEDSLRGRITYDRSRLDDGWLGVQDDAARRWSTLLSETSLPLQRVDPLGHITSIQYDTRHDVAAVRQPSGRTWQYRYDAARRLTAIEAPGRSNTTQTYDSGGRLTEVRRGATLWREYAYDVHGRLVEERTAAGRAVAYEYNSAGLVSRQTLPDGTASFGYDGAGQLIAVEHADYQVTQEYHPDGHLARRLYRPAGLDLRLPQDSLGRRAGIALNNLVVEYEYGQQGALRVIRLPDGSELTIDIDVAARPTRIAHSGGVAMGIGYDRDDEVTSVGVVDDQQALLFLERYEFDAVGNVIRRQSHGRPAREYKYDEDRRLIAQRGDAGETIFRYSVDGDLMSIATPDGASSWELDVEGRPTCRGSEAFFDWDPCGQLASIDAIDRKVEHFSDTAGRLTDRIVGPEHWRYGYLPDGDRLWRAKMDDGQWGDVQWYAYLEEGLVGWRDADGVTWLLVCLPGSDWPLAVCGSDGSTYLVIADRLRSIRRWLAPDGTIIASADYGPYGERVRAIGEAPLAVYAGMVCDDADLYYARQRYYDPELCRFISLDPLIGTHEEPESHNAYAYALNNPLGYRDPTGTAGNETNATLKWKIKLEERYKARSNEQMKDWIRSVENRIEQGIHGPTSHLIDDKEFLELIDQRNELVDEMNRRAGHPVPSRTKGTRAPPASNGRVGSQSSNSVKGSSNPGQGQGASRGNSPSASGRSGRIGPSSNSSGAVSYEPSPNTTGRLAGTPEPSPNTTGRIGAGEPSSSGGRSAAESSRSRPPATESASSQSGRSSERATGSSRSSRSRTGSSSSSRRGTQSAVSELQGEGAGGSRINKGLNALGVITSLMGIVQTTSEGYRRGGVTGAIASGGMETVTTAVLTRFPLLATTVEIHRYNSQMIEMGVAAVEERQAQQQARAIERRLLGVAKGEDPDDPERAEPGVIEQTIRQAVNEAEEAARATESQQCVEYTGRASRQSQRDRSG